MLLPTRGTTGGRVGTVKEGTHAARLYPSGAPSLAVLAGLTSSSSQAGGGGERCFQCSRIGSLKSLLYP